MTDKDHNLFCIVLHCFAFISQFIVFYCVFWAKCPQYPKKCPKAHLKRLKFFSCMKKTSHRRELLSTPNFTLILHSRPYLWVFFFIPKFNKIFLLVSHSFQMTNRSDIYDTYVRILEKLNILLNYNILCLSKFI